MSITIKDIAKELNISPSAVSKALNNRPGVSSAVKLKIQTYAEKKGYKPYISTRETGMYNKDINIVGIIYPQQTGTNLIRKIQDGIDSIFYKSEFFEMRFAVDTINDLNSMQKIELFLRQIINIGNLAGLIFAFIDVSDKIINFLQKNSIPSVILNHFSQLGKCVYIDNENAVFNAVEKLIKLGRKNIGIIIPDESSSTIWKDRLTGYIKALKKHNMDYHPDLVVYEGTFTFENVRLATKKIVRDTPEIDAVIYNSDFQAFAGIKTLKDMNKKIPDDIAVIGFDNMDYDIIIEPSLSSVDQPMFKMGKIGADMLIKSIKNKNFTPKSVKLDAKIILRKSCLKNYKDKKWN